MYLGGKPPMWWLQRASAKGKAALMAGLALWFKHGVQGDLETPGQARTGTVFHLEGRQGRYRDWEVLKIVSKIGKAAGVTVYVNPKHPDRVKYASAHDFRRACGGRHG